jgi:hypothetical protein
MTAILGLDAAECKSEKRLANQEAFAPQSLGFAGPAGNEQRRGEAFHRRECLGMLEPASPDLVRLCTGKRSFRNHPVAKSP